MDDKWKQQGPTGIPGQPSEPTGIPGQPPPPSDRPSPSQHSSGFEFNHPTVVSLLYLVAPLLGVTAIVGVVLAYVWKGEAHAEWETSHYQYLINTFWLAVVGTLVSIVLMIVLIGLFLLFAVWVLVIVRCVLSLVNAQKRQPMPKPATWLA